jgi:hypothetical protein
MPKRESYHNLIDACMALDEDPLTGGNTTVIFRKILSDYFFKKETYDSKSMELFFENFPAPPFIAEKNSLINVDIEEMSSYITGETVNDSLCGKIMLSPQYLKYAYPHHPPSFAKLPNDVMEELIKKAKDKNDVIINAFEKMSSDRKSDKSRKVLTLVALILKNIHGKTGLPFNKLNKKAEDIIRSIFTDCDKTFKASQKQTADLKDDNKIKTLIKEFFTIKKFQDIAEISSMFKNELERYRKRTLRE